MKVEILAVRPGKETTGAWKNLAIVDARLSLGNYSVVIRNVHIKKKEDISIAMWPSFKIEEQFSPMLGFGDHDREVRNAIHSAYTAWQNSLERTGTGSPHQEEGMETLSQDEIYMAKEAAKLSKLKSVAYGMPEILPF